MKSKALIPQQTNGNGGYLSDLYIWFQNLLGIVDFGLAIGKDANGTCRQVVFLAPELDNTGRSSFVVGQESSTQLCARFLIDTSLDIRTNLHKNYFSQCSIYI